MEKERGIIIHTTKKEACAAVEFDLFDKRKKKNMISNRNKFTKYYKENGELINRKEQAEL